MKLKLLLSIALLFAGTANAALITPDIIFGSGNTNRGFTVNTFGDLELGLRAKRRYTPNDEIGVGIIQDGAGNYLFDSTGASIPSNRSFWNFDWSINSDTTDGTTALSAFNFFLLVDYDPSSAQNLQQYDPLSMISTGYYLGNNGTGNGSALFTPADNHVEAELANFNVAQNSVNMGFLTGAPIGAGQFYVELQAFDMNNNLVGSTGINVFVDTTPVPAPSALALSLAALGGLMLLRVRRRKM